MPALRLIKIDLLEATAFLAAWSLLLVTLTAKVVNTSKDLEFAADESIRKLDEVEAGIRQHEEGHPDVQSEVERIEARVSDITQRMEEVTVEAERLAEENEQLRRQLAARDAEE